MIPEEMRLKRSKAIESQAPAGSSWCAGCQSFRDLADFAKGVTQCRACASAKSHAATIAKTYGITSDDYETLLERQSGRCAICGGKPRSKRLAVDHNHTTGAVRGLLCSRCNHDLMGAAWDSLAIAVALWHYLNTPPASGDWLPIEAQPRLASAESAASSPNLDFVARRDEAKSLPGNDGRPVGECQRPHAIPSGSLSVPGKRGVWRIWCEDESDPPF